MKELYPLDYEEESLLDDEKVILNPQPRVSHSHKASQPRIQEEVSEPKYESNKISEKSKISS
jgi:hypothetical protein